MNSGYLLLLKEREEELKEKLKDLEEKGHIIFQETYYDNLNFKIKNEIYELNGKIYYVRYADNECVEIRKLWEAK